MPRYTGVDTIIFVDTDGNQYQVKDIRPIEVQTLAFEIDKKENDLLDEVSSRQDVFGEFAENQSWRIFDMNIEKLTEVNFDVTKIKRLKIPV